MEALRRFFLYSWVTGKKKCPLYHLLLQIVIRLFFFVFIPKWAIFWMCHSLSLWEAEMQWGQSKAMISGLWNCDLSLLPVCRIDHTGWPCILNQFFFLWAYWVIFVMNRKAFFLSLLFIHLIPYCPLSGSKICIKRPDKAILGRSNRRGNDRFCPLTSSPLRYNRDVGEKNACQRPHPGLFSTSLWNTNSPVTQALPFLEVNQTIPLFWVKLHLFHNSLLLSLIWRFSVCVLDFGIVILFYSFGFMGVFEQCLIFLYESWNVIVEVTQIFEILVGWHPWLSCVHRVDTCTKAKFRLAF